MKIAIIMDALSQVHIDKDTTFALAEEVQARGAEIYYLQHQDIQIRQVEVWAKVRRIEFVRKNPCYLWRSEPFYSKLDDFDVVLERKDPPFDEAYFFGTHYLSLLKKAKVVNRPSSLRNAPEKLYSLNFPEVIPQTLITNQASEVKAFMKEQGGRCIIKPLNKCGGSGVLFLSEEDKNFYSLLEMSTQEGKEHIIAQEYLPAIRQGDKRIILVNGVARGGLMRTPAEHEHRGNIHVGGSTSLSPLTKREEWLVERIADKLRADGLYFVGLDVIGDFITEINVTSPTGIQEIYQQGGEKIAQIFWDELHHFAG